jgi:hypothetical protein
MCDRTNLSGGSGATPTITVKVVDQSNTAMNAGAAQPTVSLALVCDQANTPGGQSGLGGTLSAATVSGGITFPAATFTGRVGTYQLIATTSTTGVTGPALTSSPISFTVQSGIPDHCTFLGAAASGNLAGSFNQLNGAAPSITVQVQDQDNNAVTNNVAAVAVTLSLQNPAQAAGFGALASPTVIAPVSLPLVATNANNGSGNVVFAVPALTCAGTTPNITPNKNTFLAAGNNGAALANAATASQASIQFKVTPTNGNTTPVTNADFALVFSTQPQAVWTSQVQAGSLTVQIRDQAGTVMSTNTDTVTLTVIGPDTLTAFSPAGFTFSPGTTNVNAGTATSTGPTITCTNNVGIGTTYRLLATASDANGASLAAAVSQCFDVVANNPNALFFVQQPSNLALTTNPNPTNNTNPRTMAPPVIIEFQDINGNTYTTTQQAVSLAVTNGSGTGGSLAGIGSATPTSGFATYGGIQITGTPATAYILTPSSPTGGVGGTTLTGTNSNQFVGQ